tara:strand:- start:937 stop:1119 length:183 start_codon:yes stop_codon:yes gene_type:complete
MNVTVIPIEKIHPNDHPEIQDKTPANNAISMAGTENTAAIALMISAQYIILDRVSFILRV